MNSSLLVMLGLAVAAIALANMGGPPPTEPIVIHLVAEPPRRRSIGCAGWLLGAGLALMVFMILK